MSNHRATTRTRRSRSRRTAPVVAVVAVLATLAGGAAAAGFSSLAAGDEPAAPVVAPTETAPPPTTAPGTTQDGWTEQEDGDPAVVSTSSGDGELLVVDVTDIRPGFACTAEEAQAPKNGQFVALTVEVRPGADFAEEMSMVPTTAADFVAVGPDGEPVADSAGNATGCVPAEQALTPVVTVGRPSTGTVVLDAPVGTTAIRYVPGGFQWPVPAGE